MGETILGNINWLRRYSMDTARQYKINTTDFMRRTQPLTTFSEPGVSNLVALVNITLDDTLNRNMVARIHQSARTGVGVVKAILADLPNEINFKRNWLGVEVRYYLDPTNVQVGEVQSISFSKFINASGFSLEFFWDTDCQLTGLALYLKELKADRDMFVLKYSPVGIDGIVILRNESKIGQLVSGIKVAYRDLLAAMIVSSPTEEVLLSDYFS